MTGDDRTAAQVLANGADAAGESRGDETLSSGAERRSGETLSSGAERRSGETMSSGAERRGGEGRAFAPRTGYGAAAPLVPSGRPGAEEAEAAVRTLIRWAGDDPDREGLRETPRRVIGAFREFFSGYEADPEEILRRTFEETDGYDEMVLLKDIRFVSHCEHHMAPIIGRAHVAYLPHKRVIGISKLARAVEIYARRLQIQEKMTAQIANAIEDILQPLGVAVVIEAAHQCMTTRGVNRPGLVMTTSRMLGAFRSDPATRREFLAMIGTASRGATSLA